MQERRSPFAPSELNVKVQSHPRSGAYRKGDPYIMAVAFSEQPHALDSE